MQVVRIGSLGVLGIKLRPQVTAEYVGIPRITEVDQGLSKFAQRMMSAAIHQHRCIDSTVLVESFLLPKKVETSDTGPAQFQLSIDPA